MLTLTTDRAWMLFNRKYLTLWNCIGGEEVVILPQAALDGAWRPRAPSAERAVVWEPRPRFGSGTAWGHGLEAASAALLL